MPWLLAEDSWYWSGFNRDNCLCHINQKKEASAGWHGHLCSIGFLDCRDLESCIFPTQEKEKQGTKRFLILKWVGKVKSSIKLSTEWVSLSLLKSVKFAEDCEVCAVGVLLECNTSTKYQKNLLVCSELL